MRSHSQFAALLGGSRRAYELWMLRAETSTPPSNTLPVGQPIIALIEVGEASQAALTQSLISLAAEGVLAICIGTSETPTLADAVPKIDWAAKPWLMPIAAGDTLAPGTIDAYRAIVAKSGGRIAYADDDLMDTAGRRTKPHFKPAWNSEMFRHFNYLVGACIMQVTRAELQYNAASADWAEQLIADRVREEVPLQVCKILHHRRIRPSPRQPDAPLILRAELPPISVIVPTRNGLDLLRTCLSGLAVTNYPDVKVIIVDNDSDDPDALAFMANLNPAFYEILRHPGVFNYSAINNRAAAAAKGRLLCLLNNDIEVLEPNWLATMAVQATRKDVGAVGARLLYPDGRIQHAGVVLGMGGAAGHAHRLQNPDEEGYFSRHALPQFISAVTGACLVVDRERFLSVGGLDESDFAVAFNDVDLCMRLNQRGWQSLYEPRATLIHHESVSRGSDRDPISAARFAKELAALKRRWGTENLVDPYHHPELSRESQNFVVRL